MYHSKQSTLKSCLFCILTVLFCPINLVSQSIGDILFTGYNSRGNDDFAFIAARDIGGGLEIRFTDNGWLSAGGFRLGEGELVYTTPPAGLKQGDHIAIDVGTGNLISGTGSVSLINSINFSASGDGVIAFTGSLSNPSPIAALNMNTVWTNAVSSNTSDIPTGLIDGITAFNLLVGGSERDGGVYNCSVAQGSLSTLQAAVYNSANWTTSNSSHLDLPCTSTWDGTNWTNAIPTVASNVVINSSTSLTSDLDCNELLISPGFTLNLGAHNLLIRGSVNNLGNGIISSGTITFDRSGTTVIQGDEIRHEDILNLSARTSLNAGGLLTLTASSAGSYGQLDGEGTANQIKAQVYVDPMIPRFYHLASPFNNSLLSEFNEGNDLISASNSQGSIWRWNASTAEWQAPGLPGSTFSNRGEAYAIFIGTIGGKTFVRPNEGPITLQGSTNNSDIIVPLVYHDGQGKGSFVGGASRAATQGWNFVANPFCSAYDWDQQTIPANLASAIYRFDGNSYTSYVAGVGGGSQYIPPFQGFFVQLTANVTESLTFANSNRNPSQNPALSKTKPHHIDGLSVFVENSMGKRDQLFIGFDPQASWGFDSKLDAFKFLNQAEFPSLYTRVKGINYSVMRNPPLKDQLAIPIYLDYSDSNDSLLLQFDPSTLQTSSTIRVQDLKTGDYFSVNQPYPFIHDSSFQKQRFMIHFSNSEKLEEENKTSSSNPWSVYSRGSFVFIQNKTSFPEVVVEIWSPSGALILKVKSSDKLIQIPVEEKGVLMVRLSAEKYMETKKLVH